jgi:hypothetical protein
MREIRGLRHLEVEKRRLKQIFAELTRNTGTSLDGEGPKKAEIEDSRMLLRQVSESTCVTNELSPHDP